MVYFLQVCDNLPSYRQFNQLADMNMLLEIENTFILLVRTLVQQLFIDTSYWNTLKIELHDKLGIEITAETVAKEVAKFRGKSEQSDCSTNKKPEHRNYSCEAFVDAILTWVVADDQVYNCLF